MFNITLENTNGEKLLFGANSPFTVTEFDGLSAPEATINTSALALVDGAKFNSSKTNPRTINLAFAIERDAEANRLEVYKVIKTKQFIRLYYKSEMRNVFIDGYVQHLNIEHFAVKQIVTVTIFCPFPYLRSADESVTELSNIAALFHFPFTSPSVGTLVFGTINALSSMEIENTGSIETGLIIELYANGAVTNPKVFNYVTGEYIGVDYSMQEGDTIVIDTRQGSKTITLIRNAVSTNLFNYLAVGSKWLQLPAGVSVFTYEVSDGSASDLIIGIRYNALFEGV